ncbi:MAG: thrombospondin type 3 repeat-containing protein [Planctomycetes bacterium]|nr:thrombospondin type 3 repeat-containing protein [Planctomycetota bacterium]
MKGKVMNAVTRILLVAGTLPALVGVLIVAEGCVNVPGGLILDNGIVDGDGSDGLVLDSDGDGFSDDEEINFIPGTDPFDPTDNPNNVRDTDGDGCSDYDELNFDGFCDNDPNTPPPDLDGDGTPDDSDNCPFTSNADQADTDGDGASPTIVSVTSVEPFLDTDPIELRLDDGTYHNTTIPSRDVDLDTITLVDAVPAGRIANKSTFARRKLGPDVRMVLYGAAPAPSVDTWGYRGAIADTHEGLHAKLKVRVEVTVDDGADRRHIFTWTAVVVAG